MSKTNKTTIVLESGQAQVDIVDVVSAIKKAWVKAGHTASELTNLHVYVKFENSVAYFVASDNTVTGSVNILSEDLITAVIFDEP